MNDTHTLCYWKELWRLTSSFDNNDINQKCRDSIRNRLNGVREQLEKGLSYFEPQSSDSFKKLSSKHSKHTKVLSFIEKLQQFMGLDSCQSWDIFCHYLSNRFHGSIETTLDNFSFVNLLVNQLFTDVWTFYNSERFFMLKQLKLIIEYKSKDDYIYRNEFSDIIEKITLKKLKSSLIRQFKMLIEEMPPTKAQNGDMITFEIQSKWMKRNLNEQVEILTLILLIIDEDMLSVQEFKQLFLLFKLHNFGRQPNYYKYLDESHSSIVTKIVYAEVAIFYKIISDCKGESILAIINSVKDDVEGEIVRLQHNEEHGAFLLAWMLLLLEDPVSEEMFINRYQHFGTKALQLRVFEFLYHMSTHPMFSSSDKCGIIFRNSIYKLLSKMCDKFDGDGSLALHPYLIELSGEILSTPSIAESFWNIINNSSTAGVVSLWNTALEYFPYDFKTLSILVASLVSASTNSFQNTVSQLKSLPMFTKKYKPRMVTISNMSDEENAIIARDYYPYENKEIVIQAKTEAVIMDRRNTTLIHFRTNISYWKIFYNEIETLINYNLLHNYDITENIDSIIWGIKVVSAILKMNDTIVPEYLVQPCEAVFELLIRFSHLKKTYTNLISSCIAVSVLLIPKFSREIYTRLTNIKLLPYVTNTNLSVEQYVNGETFNTSLIGQFLVNIEQICGEYNLFTTYLDMVLAFYDTGYDKEIALGILLPALIFVIREVFPHMLVWYFKSSQEKRKLCFKCLSYIFKILNLSPERTSQPTDLLLNKISIFSLLNTESGIALLKLVAFGEQNIQNLMEEETNWINGPCNDQIKMIQMSLSVLMQSLRLKYLVKEKSTLSPLEYLIYTQPKQEETMRVVPIVTEYMSHVFNKNLPNTACKLLKRFALESRMSLLVCLDMSSHQICTVFLERLRDETESNSLKTAILEFVSTCVEKQPGLTEVFFKISHPQDEARIFMKEDESEKSDGILTFMAEYLAAVKNNTSSLYSPLLSCIMGLFHALWKNNMQILVKDLRKNSNFWEYLCSPLFQDILPDIKAYSQIYNMIGIELYLFEGKVDNSLKIALEKLFNHNDKYVKKWVEYIVTFEGRKSKEESIDDVPSWLSLLTSWKDFVAIATKFLPFPITSENKYIMSSICLNTLNQEIEFMDNRIIIMLSEMYVMYLYNWKEDCFDDRQEFAEQIALLLCNMATALENLHYRAKYAILAIGTFSLNILTYDLKPEKELSYKIFHSICHINNLQLDKLCGNNENQHANNIAKGDLDSIMMGLKLLEQSINILKDDFLSSDDSFVQMNLINKLVIYTTNMIHKNTFAAQTTAALHCLIAFAQSSTSKYLLFCNLSQNLWLKFLPPKDLIESFNETTNSNVSAWNANNWWNIYKSGIELVTAILQQHKSYFASDAILFVGVQEEYLTESLLLLRQTLEIDAFDLTSAVLYLIAELLEYSNKWKNEHNQSLVNLMRAITMCLHYCITLILRPRGIHLTVDNPSTLTDESENTGPTPKVTTVLNRLLKLMNLSAICLKKFSPNVIDLLTNPCFEITQWYPIMELQFGVPKLSSDLFPNLTFGTMLSAVCILTRSLSFNYHAEDTPLNTIKNTSVRKGLIRKRISGLGGNEESIRRRSFRSDSVTSISSTTSMSITPHWLAALDKKLVVMTLENILTVLASQSLLAIKDPKMANRDKQLVRRELCAELPIFHDFVKKKIIEYSQFKNHLCRKKYGIYPLLPDDDSIQLDSQVCMSIESECESDENLFTPPPPPAPRRRTSDSMRVSVVRKLHLDKTKQVSEITQSSKDGEKSMSSTASTSGSQKPTSRSTKHVTWDEYSLSSQEETNFMDAEDVDYSILSEVQMVEEDYLHFLSNTFLYICQTDH